MNLFVATAPAFFGRFQIRRIQTGISIGAANDFLQFGVVDRTLELLFDLLRLRVFRFVHFIHHFGWNFWI